MPDLLNRNDQSLIVSMLERASLVEDGHGRAALITESGLNSADFDLDGTPHNFAVMFIDRLVNVEHRSALGVVLNRISSRYGAVPVDLDRLRREIFGNGFDQNEAAPPSPISGTPIAAGLNALTALTADPEIREAALRFRTVFQTSREQIAVVTGYKGLHDRLHELRDKCVEPMTRALPGFPRDEDVRTEFDEYRITLEGIMRQLHTRTAEFHSADTSWISSFDSALEDVRRALSGLDDVLLKRVLRNLDRELAMRLTRINSDLNASARALRLNDLVLALHEICEHGTVSARTPRHSGGFGPGPTRWPTWRKLCRDSSICTISGRIWTTCCAPSPTTKPRRMSTTCFPISIAGSGRSRATRASPGRSRSGRISKSFHARRKHRA